jgi:predicted DNA-binding transcriptional regulator AlpA
MTANQEEITVTLPRLMTQQDLCAYLGKSPAWAERARHFGEGPAFVKLGRHVRYRAEDVEAWVNSNICTATKHGGC